MKDLFQRIDKVVIYWIIIFVLSFTTIVLGWKVNNDKHEIERLENKIEDLNAELSQRNC